MPIVRRFAVGLGSRGTKSHSVFVTAFFLAIPIPYSLLCAVCRLLSLSAVLVAFRLCTFLRRRMITTAFFIFYFCTMSGAHSPPQKAHADK